MTVEIPGPKLDQTSPAAQPKKELRKGDVNAKEYEREARLAEALHNTMSTPSEILKRNLSGRDVEEYYMCATHMPGRSARPWMHMDFGSFCARPCAEHTLTLRALRAALGHSGSE